jgi:hypothetical protein
MLYQALDLGMILFPKSSHMDRKPFQQSLIMMIRLSYLFIGSIFVLTILTYYIIFHIATFQIGYVYTFQISLPKPNS